MSKEIEFKIKLTKEEAENVILRLIAECMTFPFETVLKTDDYWKSKDGASAKQGQVIRLRSEYEIGPITMNVLYCDDETTNVTNSIENDLLFKWFFDEKQSELNILNKLPRRSFVTYKQKAYTGNSEVNSEYEAALFNSHEPANNIPDVVERCFDALGTRYFSKIKRCCSLHDVPYDTPKGKSHNGTINIDIDNVNNLYYFEIEFVPDDIKSNNDLDQDEILDILENVVSRYRINPENKDRRPWVEILGINK